VPAGKGRRSNKNRLNGRAGMRMSVEDSAEWGKQVKLTGFNQEMSCLYLLNIK
jgi:hypothetical protein